MSNPIDKYFELSARKAEYFVKEIYYQYYDSSTTKRMELAKIYKDESIVIWNGSLIRGTESLQNFLKQLPPSKHTIEYFDAHPMPNSPPEATMLLVTVGGSVIYGDGYPQEFNQTFTLLPVSGDDGQYCIATDCFRLTSDPIQHS